MVLAGFLAIFLPGFSWSFILMAQQDVGPLARLAASIGLSLVLMPFTVFGLHLTLGVKVTTTSVIIVGLALSAVPLVYIRWHRWWATHSHRKHL